MQMSRWQRVRTFLHLFLVGIKRRMVLGARLVLIVDGKVLLIKHTYMPGWHFPGGGVEPGETAADCARREGLEETGFEAGPGLQLFGLYLKVSEATNRDHVAVFVSRAARQVSQFRANGEIAAIGWFAPDGLPVEIEPGTAQRIREIVDGVPVAALW
jgi:8-oxo-dGTP pyrophosphatase MutT (NUDIX family)